MERDEIARVLVTHKEELRSFGVQSLALFGSIVRGEARSDSDADILVEFSKPVGLFGFIGLKHRLEEILGRPVDLATRAALKPQLRDSILEECVDAL